MPTKSSQKTYRQLRQELDDVIARLQDPDCAVDDAAELFEEAIRRITELERHLERAENRITKVTLTAVNLTPDTTDGSSGEVAA